MPLHHIIPKHEWFERFGSMNGVNAKDNLVRLTLSQHAEVHLLLYELNHNDNDLEAHQACVGTILKKKKLQEKQDLHNNEPVKKKKRKKHKSRTTYRKWSI